MTPENPPEYGMRGHRVPGLAPEYIHQVTVKVRDVLGLRKRSFQGDNPEKLVSTLEHFGINIDVIDDAEWIDATKATVDPQKGMIYVPEKLYGEICRGKPEAIRILLHEIGHIVLGHKPMLHFSTSRPIENEDSEWQADFFADTMIALLKLPKPAAQMELKF
ncbi:MULTISPECIES: peptidase [Pseudomonas]|nr:MULTISPECIES: peptidase [Pseudomonas]